MSSLILPSRMNLRGVEWLFRRPEHSAQDVAFEVGLEAISRRFEDAHDFGRTSVDQLAPSHFIRSGRALQRSCVMRTSGIKNEHNRRSSAPTAAAQKALVQRAGRGIASMLTLSQARRNYLGRTLNLVESFLIVLSSAAIKPSTTSSRAGSM